MMAEAGPVWPFSMDNGPRCGGVNAVFAGIVDVFDASLSLRRFSEFLLEAVVGINSGGAAGASALFEDHMPSL